MFAQLPGRGRRGGCSGAGSPGLLFCAGLHLAITNVVAVLALGVLTMIPRRPAATTIRELGKEGLLLRGAANDTSATQRGVGREGGRESNLTGRPIGVECGGLRFPGLTV